MMRTSKALQWFLDRFAIKGRWPCFYCGRKSAEESLTTVEVHREDGVMFETGCIYCTNDDLVAEAREALEDERLEIFRRRDQELRAVGELAAPRKARTVILPIGFTLEMKFDEEVAWNPHFDMVCKSHGLVLDEAVAKYVTLESARARINVAAPRPVHGSVFCRGETLDPFLGATFAPGAWAELVFKNLSGFNFTLRGSLLVEVLSEGS